MANVLSLDEKLARITALTELRADDEFSGMRFAAIYERHRNVVEREAREAVRIARQAAQVAAKVAKRAQLFSYSRVGGLYFWRIGRLGGSFYFAKACVAAVCVSLSLAACSPDEPKQPETKVFHRVAGDPQELVIRGGRWVPQREVTNSGVTILRGR